MNDIKALREETGVSIMKCKQALTEASGDMDTARELIRGLSAKAAAKKADRDLGAGIVQSYIHPNNTIGVLVNLGCETDYVARNEDFIALANDIAMHIAAMMPESISDLVEQGFVKDPETTIGKLLEEATLKIGERIEVTEFVRYAI
ncbi:MAG: elongation factor Ts [Candidatus Pacebacteria bacterium]|nr:elongation factor Ts [Candidatus Paceibacterota bacterium]